MMINIWSYLHSIKRSFPLALLWMGFMVFFTYTILLLAIVETDTNFKTVFYEQQSSYISLFVNCGLVLMLVLDYVNSHPRSITPCSFVLPFIAIMLCLIIKAHCDSNLKDILGNYMWPISSENLSIVAYTLFLITIISVRRKNLRYCLTI